VETAGDTIHLRSEEGRVMEMGSEDQGELGREGSRLTGGDGFFSGDGAFIPMVAPAKICGRFGIGNGA
jgi:phosphoketolase